MKKLIFILFVLMQFGYSVSAQNERTFYQVCYNKDAKSYIDFERDELRVKTLNDDSIVFDSNGTPYTAKKVAGFNFLEGGKDVFHFYAYKVDDNSFFINSVGMSSSAFSYYSADKNMLDEDDQNVRCALNGLKQFGSIVKSFKEKRDMAEKAKKQEFEAETTSVITEYIKNYKSQVKDPVIEKGIQLWWKGGDPNAVVINPLLRIYYIQSAYEYTRNALGIVLRKTKDAIILFKKKSENKCYIQLHSFGFESLGNGAFSDEVKSWKKGDYYFPGFLALPGERKIYSGNLYEVNCESFQQ